MSVTKMSVKNIEFVKDYIKHFHELTVYDEQNALKLIELAEVIKTCSANGSKILLLGNGGSAAICNHIAIDFTKNAGIRALSFSDSSLITCLANDYGYENWMQQALALYADAGDLVIIISSSGRSGNVVASAKWCCSNNMTFVTLTGMSATNPLRSLSLEASFLELWVDSSGYNIIETIHQFWLMTVVDMCIGAITYEA